jgi:seryl-tRNA synthetase
VRGRFFLSDVVAGWGDTQHERISQLLAWVTNNTNIPRLRKHVRPEGVRQLALRRRIQTARARSGQMDAAQMRLELEEASRQSAEQGKYFDELVEENSQLKDDVLELEAKLEDTKDELATKQFYVQSLKDQLVRAGAGRTSILDA